MNGLDGQTGFDVSQLQIGWRNTPTLFASRALASSRGPANVYAPDSGRSRRVPPLEPLLVSGVRLWNNLSV